MLSMMFYRNRNSLDYVIKMWTHYSIIYAIRVQVVGTIRGSGAHLGFLESRDPNFRKEANQSLHKKWSFPLRTFAENVTKPVVSCGFGHIYLRNP